MVNNFLFNNFFEKSSTFRENREKLFWGRIWQFLKERRRLVPKINITFLLPMTCWIFYYLAVFSKKAVIFWKNGKTPFLWAESLEGTEGMATKMNITFFMGNEVLNIFSCNNFFQKNSIFEESKEKNVGGRDHFLGNLR